MRSACVCVGSSFEGGPSAPLPPPSARRERVALGLKLGGSGTSSMACGLSADLRRATLTRSQAGLHDVVGVASRQAREIAVRVRAVSAASVVPAPDPHQRARSTTPPFHDQRVGASRIFLSQPGPRKKVGSAARGGTPGIPRFRRPFGSGGLVATASNPGERASASAAALRARIRAQDRVRLTPSPSHVSPLGISQRYEGRKPAASAA